MPFRHSVLAVEICYPLQPGGTLVGQLRQAIEQHPAQASAREKWSFYRWLSETLYNNLHAAVSGCWDFVDDDARAQSDFTMWFQGMATREGARHTPSGVGDPYRGEHRYLTFTIALLLRRDAPSERHLARVCDVPEAQLWQRATFARVLQALPSVSFAAVKGDVVYLIPREADWGLLGSDLRQPKFHYLRPIT